MAGTVTSCTHTLIDVGTTYKTTLLKNNAKHKFFDTSVGSSTVPPLRVCAEPLNVFRLYFALSTTNIAPFSHNYV